MDIEKHSNESSTRKERSLFLKVDGIETSDGAGVKLTRVIGSSNLDMLDPFLLLDCIESDDANDYIGGFPSHPHRGFETVTYLLNGRMRHEDSEGNSGVVESEGVQWMTAARGIIHSEIPEQEQGLLKGFQLWVNLPAYAKMCKPAYQEFLPHQIPNESSTNGTKVRVIAGQTKNGTLGPIRNHYTEPTYLDVSLPAKTSFEQPIPIDHNCFIYVIDGELEVASQDAKNSEKKQETLKARTLGILTKGEKLTVTSPNFETRFLLVAGKPLNETVARSGPFVMNSQAEIIQAYKDFNSGNF